MEEKKPLQTRENYFPLWETNDPNSGRYRWFPFLLAEDGGFPLEPPPAFLSPSPIPDRKKRGDDHGQHHQETDPEERPEQDIQHVRPLSLAGPGSFVCALPMRSLFRVLAVYRFRDSHAKEIPGRKWYHSRIRYTVLESKVHLSREYFRAHSILIRKERRCPIRTGTLRNVGHSPNPHPWDLPSPAACMP